jgi:hypothetical protein
VYWSAFLVNEWSRSEQPGEIPEQLRIDYIEASNRDDAFEEAMSQFRAKFGAEAEPTRVEIIPTLRQRPQ